MGFLSGITKIIGASSKTARRGARAQQAFGERKSAIDLERAYRNREQYMDEANQRKLALNESLAQRGMGFGTEAERQKGLFESANQRALLTLGEDIELGGAAQKANKYQYLLNKRLRPLQTIDTILGMGESAFGAMKGLGGGAAEEGPVDLSSADFG